jgi:hypothetical protein
MHPCAHSRKKVIQTNQRGKEVLLREDALVVIRKGTRLKLASTNQGFPQGNPAAPVSPEKTHMKLNKGFLKAQSKVREKNDSVTSVNGNDNIKHKICYTCHQKGHLGKDCPNSKNPKLNHIHHSNEKFRSNSNDSSAPKVIISQRKGTKAIWVPKSLITNLVGPNAHWVPKHA